MESPSLHNIKYFLTVQYAPRLNLTISRLKQLLENAEANRKKCLIARTTGTSVAGVGMGVTLTGLIAAPFTLGISLAVTSTVGVILGIAGSLTSIATSITDWVIEDDDKAEVVRLLGILHESEQEWTREANNLLGTVLAKDLPILPTLISYCLERQNCSSTGKTLDKEVDNINDLREGDQIYRRDDIIGIVNHHGICIRKDGILQVIDFGQKHSGAGNEVVVKSLDRFCQQMKGQLKKRIYNQGVCLPISETIRFANMAINGHLPGFSLNYNLFTNNCEHFATFLKQGAPASTQIGIVSAIGTYSSIGVKPVQHTIEAFGSISLLIGKISKTAASGVLDVTEAALPAISGLSKACIALGPVGTALDIGMLVHEFMKEKANVLLIKSTLTCLEKQREMIPAFQQEIEQYSYVITKRRILEQQRKYQKDQEAGIALKKRLIVIAIVVCLLMIFFFIIRQ